MKQFEKWNKIHRINDVRLLTEPDINNNEKQRRKAWRAALEEMLTQLNNIYGEDFENSDIVKWIKSELGDT